MDGLRLNLGLYGEEMPRDGNMERKGSPELPPKPNRTIGKFSLKDDSLTPFKKKIDDFTHYQSKANRSMSLQSSPDEPCYLCLRTALQCYNIIVLILGLGVLGMGIWLIMTEYSAREVSVLVGSNLFEIGTYLMIAGGGTIALLAFCGCCGTMRQDRCILAFFGVTLALVLLALCAGSALAFLFRKELSGKVKDHIRNTLSNNYGVDIKKNSDNRLITDAWDSMQRSLHCCGAYGDINSTHSWAFYKLHSKWYTQTNMRIPYVPDSCCSGNKQKCTGAEYIDGPPSKGPPIDIKYVRNEFLYTDGCYDKVIVHLEHNTFILGGVAASVPVLLLIGIVIVFCMCIRVHKEETEFEDEG